LGDSGILTFDTRPGNGYDVISLHGEFDITAAPKVDAELARLLNEGEEAGRALIVDLRDLRFMDSSGIQTLVIAHRECAKNGRTLVLVRGGSAVMRVLALCGLDTRVRIADTIDDALALGPGPPSHGTVPAAG
jgi:anti-anti-sigma factor